MRLLIDEMYSPEIARILRQRGYDVIAVKERPELIGAADRAHFAVAPLQRRAIVTENVGDYRPIATDVLGRGEHHFGLVLVSRRRYPRSKATIGATADALARFLDRHPDDDALFDSERWLP